MYPSQPPQSEHDKVVRGIKRICESHGLQVSVNLGSQKKKQVCGYYPDVYAVRGPIPAPYWVIEVETAESITDSEAQEQWVKYDRVYPAWWLAVPTACKDDAEALLKKLGITNCNVVTWEMGENDGYIFCTLPSLN